MKENIEPFKDGRKLRLFEKELLKHGKYPREIYVAWQLGKVCLLRVSDVIKLKCNQLYDVRGRVFDTVVTHDLKTNKYNPLDLMPLKDVLVDYLNWRKSKGIYSKWLFPAPTNFDKYIDRRVVYNLLRISASFLGFKHVSCHTARMTGAYILFKNSNNLPMVSRMLNHSSERITEMYLGISDPAIKSTVNNIDWEDIPK